MNFVEIISWPFAKMLWLFNHCGSYVVAIFFFAVVVKLVLIPFAIKQQKTQIKGAKLRPRIAAIEKKYAGRTDQKTLQRKQQEIMDLQKEEGYSPMSGCLPLLIQLPIIIILYNIIQNPLANILGYEDAIVNEMIHPFIPEAARASQINTLSAIFDPANAETVALIRPDILADLHSINLNLFGLNTGVIPGSVWGVYTIIPILTGVFSYASMKLTRMLMKNNPMQQAQGDTRVSNIIMDLMMPLMSLWFAIKLPALLGVYWIFQSVLGVVQQYLMNKVMPLPTYTEEEIRAILKAEKERAYTSRSAMRQNTYDSRSLHHIDDDDDDDDVYIPVIRSKFDEDDEAPAAKSASKPTTQTHQHQRKKKK